MAANQFGYKVTSDTKIRIHQLSKMGHSHRQIAAELGIARSTVQKWAAQESPHAQPTKKLGTFKWREAISAVETMQKLKKKMSNSQDYAEITLGDGKSPQILMGFGDQHIGAYGANHGEFENITNEILSTDNLHIILGGDFMEMAIRLRGVLEVTSQVLTPEMQEAFLEDWLEEIKHKVAFAVWDNHAVMRQESQAGTSSVKNILSRSVIYHNGIGHQDIHVGNQVYKCAASHKFRGSSMFNRMHAQGRYVRQEANDRELVYGFDIHTFGYTYTQDGGLERVYVTGGTLHENSGYAKRFFSLKTAPHYPCVVLHHDRHAMIPFLSIKDALRYVGA